MGLSHSAHKSYAGSVLNHYTLYTGLVVIASWGQAVLGSRLLSSFTMASSEDGPWCLSHLKRESQLRLCLDQTWPVACP